MNELQTMNGLPFVFEERSEFQLRVDQFMASAGQAVPPVPTPRDAETRLLRAKLILEEALETVQALGVAVDSRHHGVIEEIDDLELQIVSEADMVDLVDGCCDLSVVTIGTLSAFGVADRGPMAEVCDANDSKIADGYRREDGKFCKGEGFRPPDIRAELYRQGWSGWEHAPAG